LRTTIIKAKYPRGKELSHASEYTRMQKKHRPGEEAQSHQGGRQNQNKSYDNEKKKKNRRIENGPRRGGRKWLVWEGGLYVRVSMIAASLSKGQFVVARSEVLIGDEETNWRKWFEGHHGGYSSGKGAWDLRPSGTKRRDEWGEGKMLSEGQTYDKEAKRAPFST